MRKQGRISAPSSIRVALRMLDRADKRIYLFHLSLQTLLACLDLLGIAILAFVVSSTSNLDRDISSPAGGFNRSIPAEILLFGNYGISLFAMISISLSLFVLKSIFAIYATKINLTRLSFIAMRKSMELTRTFFKSDMQKLRSQSSQNIAQGLSTGVNALYLDSLAAFSIVVSEGFLLAVIVATFLIVNFWTTTALLLYFTIVILLLQKKISKIAQKSGEIKYKSAILDMQLVQDDIESFREIYVAGGMEFEIRKIEQVRRSALKGLVNWQWVSLLPKYILEIALIFGILLGITVIYFFDISNDIKVITLFLIASTRLLPSLLRIQQATSQIVSAQPAVSAYLEIERQLGTEKLQLFPNNLIGVMDFSGIQMGPPEINVENIQFNYLGSTKVVLNKVDFKINPGEFVGLIGGSGSGKSTLMDIMLGILEPSAGRVLLSGSSPRELITRNPGYVGYVPQKSRLMNTSLVENVSQHDFSSSREQRDLRVWELLEMLDLDSEIRKLPKGIYENLGEHGSKLSGGQLQRLSLARALYSEPKLLMLDEATNSLDSRTEGIILEVLSSVRGNLTLVSIAHRSSMMKLCDRLLRLESGILRSQGKYEELSKSDPEFRKLLRIQD